MHSLSREWCEPRPQMDRHRKNSECARACAGPVGRELAGLVCRSWCAWCVGWVMERLGGIDSVGTGFGVCVCCAPVCNVRQCLNGSGDKSVGRLWLSGLAGQV